MFPTFLTSVSDCWRYRDIRRDVEGLSPLGASWPSDRKRCIFSRICRDKNETENENENENYSNDGNKNEIRDMRPEVEGLIEPAGGLLALGSEALRLLAHLPRQSETESENENENYGKNGTKNEKEDIFSRVCRDKTKQRMRTRMITTSKKREQKWKRKIKGTREWKQKTNCRLKQKNESWNGTRKTK